MHYLKNIKLLILSILIISCVNTSGNDNSLLWKVSGNGLDKPSYIFGTHHLVPITFLDSISGIREAFENTEQTVGELDMGNMAEMQMKIMGSATMPEGVTYDSLLQPDEVATVDSTLKNIVGVGLDQLGIMKPALLSNLITLSLYQQYYPSMSNEISLDQHFQDEALKRMRPVVGLEDTEDQIDILLNAQSLERQAELLMCMINNPHLLKEQMDELHVAYHSQDINYLFELSERETPDDPCPSTEEESNAVNKDRNEKWLNKLPAIMADKPSFIAVGCLHLPGDIGILEGLRNQGYTVEAVR